MRLTPADVHNVAFKKPSIGKRGYDEDEVDAFLDLVEAELGRLIEENAELTQRLGANQSGGSAGQSSRFEPNQTPAPTPEPVLQAPAPVAPTPEPAVSIAKTTPSPQKAPEPAAGTAAVQAARLLGLAQETAERLTSQAAVEAEATRSSARAESEKLVGDARIEADRLLSDAQSRSDSMVGEASARAEALERESRVRADALDRDAQVRYTQVLGQLTEQRSTLEKKIDDLRVYEREYRSRLKSWISEQLEQLDENGAAATGSGQLAQQRAE